jgi:hypothetical protein
MLCYIWGITTCVRPLYTIRINIFSTSKRRNKHTRNMYKLGEQIPFILPCLLSPRGKEGKVAKKDKLATFVFGWIIRV